MTALSLAGIDSALARPDLSAPMRARLVRLRELLVEGAQVEGAHQRPPTKAELDRYERMQVEAGGPIPARFKHLQHLNRR